MTAFFTELMNIFKTMPAYILGLFKDHPILFVIVAAVFVFVTCFSNKVANKMRSIFVLTALLMVVFSLISQSWPRIAVIIVGLLALLVCRIIGFVISEIRITRKNRRLEERALDKAAKRRGSWQNKQGYSGARKLIVEPEYVPEEMNRDEIADVIENEFADPLKKPAEEVPAKEAADDPVSEPADTVEAFDELDELEAIIRAKETE